MSDLQHRLRWLTSPLLTLLLIFFTQHAGSTQQGLVDFSSSEIRLILTHGPWPPTQSADPGNRYSGNLETIALGQKLFFDSRLSPDGHFSCASCHNPKKSFTDSQMRSVGRTLLDRNTPSLWNGVHERWLGWDGASDSLWSQSIRPILDPREMASSARQVAQVISSDQELSCRYRKVYGNSPQEEADDKATLVNAAKALGAFNASLVSGPTAFDAFRDAIQRGNKRAAALYPMAAQRGARLFVGKGQCNVCHVGAMFSNGEFADTGLPFFVRPGVVDPGRHGGIEALKKNEFNLLSKWSDANQDPSTIKTQHVHSQHRNFGEFKVPSLRNVAQTAPYMHDGQLATLEQVVRHYSEMNLERLHADGEQVLKPLGLSSQESSDLVTFLKTLSDVKSGSWRPALLKPCSINSKP